MPRAAAWRDRAALGALPAIVRSKIEAGTSVRLCYKPLLAPFRCHAATACFQNKADINLRAPRHRYPSSLSATVDIGCGCDIDRSAS
jgi:hypothetical protein